MSSEERKRYAHFLAQRAKSGFDETGNPVWALAAAAECFAVGWDEPEWAKKVLRELVVKAWRRCERERADPVLCDPVGRGKAPQFKEVLDCLTEEGMRMMAVSIHHCLEVSIPEACWLVLESIETDFVKWVIEEQASLTPEFEADLASTKVARFTKDEAAVFVDDARQEFAQVIKRLPSKVQNKIKDGRVLEISRGDFLSVSPDTFAQKFHREKWAARAWFSDVPVNEDRRRRWHCASLRVSMFSVVKGFNEIGDPIGRKSLEGRVLRDWEP